MNAARSGPVRHLVWRVAMLALIAWAGASGVSAASLDGVTLPDERTAAGSVLRLNGIALRTYSWLRVPIYVAGLYLERPSRDAEAILASPETKVIDVRFVHNVDIENARKSWREGFERNCLPPCRLAPADVERFLAAVPAMQAGDRSTLTFAHGRLELTMNGHALGAITDPMFVRAVLATFIGPDPPTERLKRELLGQAR